MTKNLSEKRRQAGCLLGGAKAEGTRVGYGKPVGLGPRG